MNLSFNIELFYLVFLAWAVAFRLSKEELTGVNIFYYGLFAIIGVLLIGEMLCDYLEVRESTCQTVKFFTAISTKSICEIVLEVWDKVKENLSFIFELILKNSKKWGS
jgi:hypothetical protein